MRAAEARLSRPVSLNKRKAFYGYKLFLLILPFLILTFIFSYYPLYGWIYSFFDYHPPRKLSESNFVGLHWFEMLVSSPVQVKKILEVMRNTFAMSGLGLLVSWLPMAFAIFMAEIRTKWFKRCVQTLTTLPNFISWVLVFSFAFALFASDGVVNRLLLDMHIIDRPIMFLQLNTHTWLTMTLWGIWKGLGWNAILYLAAIAGIDQELYEAARVDGAKRYHLMWHITLPEMLPTYFVLLLLSVASFLNNGFDQYYVFQNAFNQSRIQVLDLYVYNLGIGSGSYAVATAISMLKSIVSVVLLFSCNGLSKLVRGETIV
jgi:multiple sugar transport system permease protein/putative aldouronate transport system permease protein